MRWTRRSCSAGGADPGTLLGDGGERRRFRGNADAVPGGSVRRLGPTPDKSAERIVAGLRRPRSRATRRERGSTRGVRVAGVA